MCGIYSTVHIIGDYTVTSCTVYVCKQRVGVTYVTLYGNVNLTQGKPYTYVVRVTLLYLAYTLYPGGYRKVHA